MYWNYGANYVRLSAEKTLQPSSKRLHTREPVYADA
jgi:hypothetical protein